MTDNHPTEQRLRGILQGFGLVPKVFHSRILGEGHINLSLLLEFDAARFVLQKINPRVFREPRLVAENSYRITGHLREKAARLGEAAPVPEIIVASKGCPWVEDEEGDCWRLQRYVPDSRGLTRIENSSQAYAAGEAFGHFQKWLRDFPLQLLAPTIPHFHQLSWYLKDLDRARRDSEQLDGGRRVSHAEQDLLSVDRRRQDFAEHTSPAARSAIHGDCKLSNLLFQREGDLVLALVDLDTVMAGDSVWDFGDLVRSAAVTPRSTATASATLPGNSPGVAAALEDNPAVDFSVPVFEQLARGFLSHANEWLPASSRGNLVTASRYMTYMLAVRFLTDYLRGSVYFTISYPEQNLMRARSQLRVLSKMEGLESQLLALVRKI